MVPTPVRARPAATGRAKERENAESADCRAHTGTQVTTMSTLIAR